MLSNDATDYFNASSYNESNNNWTLCNETDKKTGWNNTGISLVDIPAVRGVLILLYCLVFLLCFFGNLILLIVVAAHPSMRTVTNFFLANLAAADFLVAIFCVIQRIVHQHLLFHWPLGDFLCRMYIFLLQLVPSTSASLLLVLSVERYVAVLKPMVARRLLTKGRLVLVATLMWLICICANIPFLFSAKVLVFQGPISSCVRDGTYVNRKVLVLISFLLWYVAPLFCMTAIYTMIGNVLWKSTAEGAVAKTSVARVSTKIVKHANHADNYSSLETPPRDATVGHQNDNSNKRLLHAVNATNEPLAATQKQEKVNGRRRVIRLLIAIIVSFALLCLPHHVRQLWLNWTPNYSHDIYGVQALFPDLAFLLLFLNSAINPVLYALMSKKFRFAIKEVFGHRKIRDKKRDHFVSSMRSTLPTTTEAYSMTEC